MERRELLLQMRKNHTLKGLKPAFVSLKINSGKIYTGGNANFILSLDKNILFFQKISFIFKKLKPKEDFEINAKRFKEYEFSGNSYIRKLTLYDAEGYFLEINFLAGTKDSISTVDNIDRIIKELKQTIGLKEVNYDEYENE